MESLSRKQHSRPRIKCIVLGAAGAGKTSIVRRYFRGTFERGSRVPTLGSDFYTGRVRSPPSEERKADSPTSVIDDSSFVSLQVWDTAGSERKAKYTAALSDEFFRHADAAMLVYDATSSTSFSTLLRWHSDLMQRMRKMNEELHRKRPFPVLIVANKMDIINERQRQNQPERHTQLVPQRDVMGLYDDFKGKDSRYEYRVSQSKDVGESSLRRVEQISSTYIATNGKWTTDGSYLDSVLHSEDRSHPDRDMVHLWCMRNGLTLVEASAFDGTGVDKAMDSLVSLALEYKAEKDQALQLEEKFKKETEEHFRTNKALDLHQRYSPKESLRLKMRGRGIAAFIHGVDVSLVNCLIPPQPATSTKVLLGPWLEDHLSVIIPNLDIGKFERQGSWSTCDSTQQVVLRSVTDMGT